MKDAVTPFLKKNIFFICCLLVFATSVFFRVYRFSDKEDLFIDEYFSVILAHYNDFGWGKYVEDTIAFKGQDIRSLFLSGDNSFAEIVSNVDSLHKITRDSPHTNLYYSLLKISFWRADTSDLGQIMERGFILNLILFSVGFLFLLLMSLRLFDSKLLTVCLLAMAFINPGAIANTMFLRPYQLQETLLILYTYMFVRCYIAIGDNTIRFATWQNMLSIALISALGILSGYFSILYIFLLCVILLFRIMLKSGKDNAVFFIFTMLLSFIFVFFIYNGYLSGIFDYRGEEALSKFGRDGFADNWTDSMRGMSREIKDYLGYPSYVYIFLALLLFAFIRKMPREKYSLLTLGVSLCAFVWIVAVIYLAPYKNIRYMLPMFPIFLLFIPGTYSLYSRKIQLMLVLVSVGWITYKAIKRDDVYIEYSSIDKTYVQDKDVPLILGAIDGWKQVAKMRYYTDDRTVEFAFDPATFLNKIEKYPESYAIIDADSAARYIFPDTARFIYEEKTNPHGFVWYKLIKKDSFQ